MIRRPPRSTRTDTLFPYTTLFRSSRRLRSDRGGGVFHFQRAHRGLTGFYSDMETRAGDPGAFARFDLTRVPSPAFVADAPKFPANLALRRHIGDESGAGVPAAPKSPDERRGGKEIFCTRSSGGSPSNSKQNTRSQTRTNQKQ